MLKRFQYLAIILVVAAVIAAPALAGTSAPVGIVTTAQRGLVDHVMAVDGTSIYDGDTLATEPTGALRLRFGGSQMVLTGNTVVTLHKTDMGVSATLVSGSVRFASVPGSLLEVRALNSVVIHSKGDQPAIGQLTVTGPTSFQVGSTKGALNVSVNGVDHAVEESTAYNVNLDGSDSQNRSPRAAGTSGGLWIAVAAVAGGTAIALFLAFRSPSKP